MTITDREKERILSLLESNFSLMWDALSALRGPDTPDPEEEIKEATTGVIRHSLGIVNYWLVACPDTEDRAELRRNLTNNTNNMASAHFLIHAKSAFNALGLKWNEVNK